MKTEEDANIENLSRKPPKMASLMANKDHPQRELLFKAIHPANSLEAWMEKGLRRVEDDEDEWIEGFAVLPTAYKGCNKESLLVYAPGPQTQVYPVPLQIADNDEGVKTKMLFHYTHRESFENFVRIFASGEEMSEEEGMDEEAQEAQDEDKILDASSVYVRIMDQIQADWDDRNPTQGNTRKNDPELLLREPGKFASRQALNQALFGVPRPGGTTTSGHKLAEVGNFCVAVLAPGHVAVASHMASARGVAMQVDREALRLLHQQAQLRKENLAKQAEAEKRTAEEARRARKSCFGRLCGGGKDTPQYWDEDAKDEDQAEEGGRTNRRRREVDKAKAEKIKTWTKEHFVAVKDMRRREFEAEMAEMEEGRAKVPKPGLREQLEMFVVNTRRFMQRMAGIKEMDDDALALYREHMQKEAQKKSATSALERLKSSRGANSVMLVKSVRSEKGERSRIMGRAATTRLEGREDSDEASSEPLPTEHRKHRKRRRRRLRRRRKKPLEVSGEASDAAEDADDTGQPQEVASAPDSGAKSALSARLATEADSDEGDGASSDSGSSSVSSDSDDKSSKSSSKPG